MNVKDVLDNLNIVVDIPQHWYSTEVDNSFENAVIDENDNIIKIKAVDGDKINFIIIDINDGMSVGTKLENNKILGVKYLNNKDDFEYIGKITDLI